MIKIVIASALAVCLTTPMLAQSDQESIGQAINDLSYSWDLEAGTLNSYQGLSRFCQSPEYRTEITDLLNNIHHYDSVLYDQLVKASRFNKDKEIEKTLQEIAEFEGEYGMKNFIDFLHKECANRNDIEKHSEELKNDIGSESYGGQVYLVETELNKFIKQITKRVDNIRQHVHHLHIK